MRQLAATALEFRAEGKTMGDVDEDFLQSGIEDKAVYLEFRAVVQPYLDKANADPWGDHSGLQAEMRAAMMEFLKKYNPELQ